MVARQDGKARRAANHTKSTLHLRRPTNWPNDSNRARLSTATPAAISSTQITLPSGHFKHTPAKNHNPAGGGTPFTTSLEEALVGVEPTMADLQSAALATWLQRLKVLLLVSLRCGL